MGTFGTNRRRGQSRAMHIVLIFLLSAASASGSSIRVMSYNLYGWNAMGQEAWKKPNLWKTIRASQPDVLGVQEVDGHEFECAGAIGNDYQVVDDGFNGDAIIYRTSVLTLQNYARRASTNRTSGARDGLAMQTLSTILANGSTSSTHIFVSAALEISSCLQHGWRTQLLHIVPARTLSSSSLATSTALTGLRTAWQSAS